MSKVKRESNNVIISASSLILDVEGTTSSISFVKDVLFPYVRKHLEPFINSSWDSADLQEVIKALKTQAKEDEENKLDGVIAIAETGEKDDIVKSVIDNVMWQMDNDRKTKSLKDLQGLIMEEGFKKGDLKGHVYDDVEPSMKDWNAQDKSIYIYSSGSVAAQKLVFGHSEKGDLLPCIKGHFDTNVGMKVESKSYKKILEEIACIPSEVAFLTDIPKEARAAKEAGITAVLLSRDGNSPLADEDVAEFPVIKSFAEIEFENGNKKRKLCSDVTTDNKPVETCAKSIDDKSNPKLTSNNEVEMMEVEEDAAVEIIKKEEVNLSAKEGKNTDQDKSEAMESDKEVNASLSVQTVAVGDKKVDSVKETVESSKRELKTNKQNQDEKDDAVTSEKEETKEVVVTLNDKDTAKSVENEKENTGKGTVKSTGCEKEKTEDSAQSIAPKEKDGVKIEKTEPMIAEATDISNDNHVEETDKASSNEISKLDSDCNTGENMIEAKEPQSETTTETSTPKVESPTDEQSKNSTCPTKSEETVEVKAALSVPDTNKTSKAEKSEKQDSSENKPTTTDSKENSSSAEGESKGNQVDSQEIPGEKLDIPEKLSSEKMDSTKEHDKFNTANDSKASSVADEQKQAESNEKETEPKEVPEKPKTDSEPNVTSDNKESGSVGVESNGSSVDAVDDAKKKEDAPEEVLLNGKGKEMVNGQSKEETNPKSIEQNGKLTNGSLNGVSSPDQESSVSKADDVTQTKSLEVKKCDPAETTPIEAVIEA